jgi:hypothetical protein
MPARVMSMTGPVRLIADGRRHGRLRRATGGKKNLGRPPPRVRLARTLQPGKLRIQGCDRFCSGLQVRNESPLRTTPSEFSSLASRRFRNAACASSQSSVPVLSQWSLPLLSRYTERAGTTTGVMPLKRWGYFNLRDTTRTGAFGGSSMVFLVPTIHCLGDRPISYSFQE